MSARKLFLLVCFLCFLFPLGINAQVITASLQGVVRDPSGAVIPGASVTVRNTGTNAVVHLTTGRDGFFLAPSLPPGPYVVTITAKGFKTVVSNTITLEVDQRAQEHFVLQVGAVTQTVTVTSAAPLLKRTTSDVGQVVDTKQIMDLPLNARNTYALAFLAPGIHGSVNFEFNGLNMSANGGLPGSTEILIDGIHSAPPLANPIAGFTVFPPPDATQEFKVQTSDFSAQFGDAGSGIINLVYKSGTNHLHGDVYEYLRNSDLDANNFFSNEHHVPLATFQRSQFGFTLGGPLVIPKIYNGHDKTFFFGDFEGLRQGSAASATQTVPTAAMRTGDFSGLVNGAGKPITIFDPMTTVSNGSGGFVRTAFTNNIIPPGRINAVSANIAKYWPLPNLPGDVNNFAAAGKSVNNDNNYDVKIDENLNNSTRFFGRFSQHRLTSSPPDLYPSSSLVAENQTLHNETGTDVAFDLTHTFSSTFLTEFRYGFSRMDEKFQPRSLGFDPSQLGLPSYIAANADALEFPGIAPANYVTIGSGGFNFRKDTFNEHTLSVNNTWIVGPHTLNFGFQLEIPQVNVHEANQADGSFSFAKTLTQGPNPTSASSTAGDAFASFLLGIGSGGMTINAKNGATTSREYALYLQDDWRVKPKLTFNLGLRWDVDTPRTERYNRMSYFDQTAASPLGSAVASAPGASACPACSNLLGGLVFVASKGVGRSQFPTEWGDFGPRFGFAYQASKNTVVRGAYGIFYYSGQITGAAGTVGSEGFAASTPYTGQIGLTGPITYLTDPFPTGIIRPPGSSDGLATLVGTTLQDNPVYNTRIPYSENWNLGIQQMLPGSVMVEASYVGSHGVKLPEGGENTTINQLTPAALMLGNALEGTVPNPFYGLITVGPLANANVSLGDLMVPYPQYTGVKINYPTGGSSVYHSIQVKAERRFASGVSFLASFTGEKLIDGPISFISNVGRNAGPQNIYDYAADRSVSSNDISRIFSFASTYQLPFGRKQRFGRNWGAVTDAFLGGWQMNGILTLDTGFPLALTTTNTSASGSPNLRPNYDPSASGCANSAVLSGSVVSRLNEYFNTACFTQPAPFTFGNVSRTLPNVRAPGERGLDFSVMKNFRLSERFTMQFNAQAFNSLNQVQFGMPNQKLSSSAFGEITSQANSPRQLQFALKILF